MHKTKTIEGQIKQAWMFDTWADLLSPDDSVVNRPARQQHA